MTLEELMANIENVTFENIKHENITTCPSRPISDENNSWTFFKSESCVSNEIGKNDDRILRHFCYDGDGY